MAEARRNKAGLGITASPNFSVIVGKGEDQKQWFIPVDLLCFHSRYFKSAFQGGFTKAENKTVELLNEDVQAFGLIVEWIYTHEIKVSARDPTMHVHSEQPVFEQLLDAWVLGDYLQMPKLQNFILKLMDERIYHCKVVPIGQFARIYELDSDSCLAQWILDCCVWTLPYNDEMLDFFELDSDIKLLRNITRKIALDVKPTKKFNLSVTEHLVKE